jgi:hypothetical protein
MSKRLSAVIAALVLIGLAAGATMATGQSSQKWGATMTGAAESPKGDANGSGTFTVSFRNGQACYTMVAKGIDKPVAAHIHKGAAGVNGPIVIDLQPSFKGSAASRTSTKCVPAKGTVVSALRKNPSGYYANVHTAKFPGGALRGQLKKQ